MAEPILDYGSVSVADWNDAQIKDEQVQSFAIFGIILIYSPLLYLELY